METPPTIEKEKEHIPSQEEIRSVFSELFKGRPYETVRVKEDEKGITLWEVTVNSKEGVLEYTYIRKGSHEKNLVASVTGIDCETETATSLPGQVAKCENGEWRLIR